MNSIQFTLGAQKKSVIQNRNKITNLPFIILIILIIILINLNITLISSININSIIISNIAIIDIQLNRLRNEFSSMHANTETTKQRKSGIIYLLSLVPGISLAQSVSVTLAHSSSSHTPTLRSPLS